VLRVEVDRCFYCGTCAGVCPQGAIELLHTGEVSIDERCVESLCRKWSCRLCVKSCPVEAIHEV